MGNYLLKIKAIQFDGYNIQEIRDEFGATGIYGTTGGNEGYLIVQTLNGSPNLVHPGDWVVQDWKSDTFIPVAEFLFKEKFSAGHTYPNNEGEFLNIGPACFTSLANQNVISYKGENYYVGCGATVFTNPVSGLTSHCVLTQGHAVKQHEDYAGRLLAF